MFELIRRLWMFLFGPRPLDVSKQLPPVTADPNPPDPLRAIPKNRRQVYEMFGNPGSAKLDRAWERAHMVVAKGLPIPRGKLYIHSLAEPYLRRALESLDDECLAYIERIGCFNFRHQRHDSFLPLSYHSWGIAVDINPAQNRVRRFSKGKAPAPFSSDWCKLWPDGITPEIVHAFEDAGWVWGGRWETFVDPMHFQLVGRR